MTIREFLNALEVVWGFGDIKSDTDTTVITYEGTVRKKDGKFFRFTFIHDWNCLTNEFYISKCYLYTQGREYEFESVIDLYNGFVGFKNEAFDLVTICVSYCLELPADKVDLTREELLKSFPSHLKPLDLKYYAIEDY